DRGDLLSMLLQAQDADDGSRLSNEQVRDEVMTLFMAGHETTAVTLSWSWYLLAQHPEVDAQLADELQTVLGERPPTVADLPRLKYAEMIVNESMRLYPPAYALARQAVNPSEIAGQSVAPGVVVIMPAWVVHRDSRWFDDGEAFRPERWAGDLVRRLPRFAYFPFGGGPRQCIGNAFATMEAVLILATIAQRFRLALEPGQQITPTPYITLRPEPGPRMRLPRRWGETDHVAASRAIDSVGPVMRIGILIPTRGVVMESARRPPVDLCWTMARHADQAGYDAVWVGDSIVAKPRLDAITTLAYLAGITTR